MVLLSGYRSQQMDQVTRTVDAQVDQSPSTGSWFCSQAREPTQTPKRRPRAPTTPANSRLIQLPRLIIPPCGILGSNPSPAPNLKPSRFLNPPGFSCPMPHFVYLIEKQADRRYIGLTGDVDHQFRDHNSDAEH